MEIRCEECHALIQIPDERVPQSSAFRLSCPRCKHKILASTKIAEGLAEGKATLTQPSCPSEVLLLVNDGPDKDVHETMSSLQPGQSAALLCVNRGEVRDQLKVMLEGMDYVVNMPAAANNALQRLRFNQYHVIVLDDDFEGKSPHSIAVFLAGLNMYIRRQMFIVLIGQRFKTADHLQAFMESANLIIHPDDLPQLATFLTQGMRDHERFYKVFTECLLEAGKKI
jgi:zinc-ribbon domain